MATAIPRQDNSSTFRAFFFGRGGFFALADKVIGFRGPHLLVSEGMTTIALGSKLKVLTGSALVFIRSNKPCNSQIHRIIQGTAE
ncbi:hypothetical protein A8A54_21700 [Brucella pseudogrignonensis]|uniref:hypothetical protein n=1 Tax=Brucella pseudogrignonensis TaxID=419475 RepID=UPI0007DA7F1B|nr:hypothetical protein [Brucella pseudogrignonensis]ANG99168.1 hypothetical protein A8A54_21700 [Brucella pseudogrignonensis]